MTLRAVRDSYDIAVIGAGPAGLNACLHALTRRIAPSVLLIDKVTPGQKPIACAEGVGRLGLEDAVAVDPSWIRHTISHAAFHAPNGECITYTDRGKGYIIDRARMQADMASQCAERGADCVFGVEVRTVTRSEGGRRTLNLGNGRSVNARVVVDASGPLTVFGKGERIGWRATDLEPAYFAHAEGVKCERDTVHIHMAGKLAPGGYCWVFPAAGDSVNIGVLVGSRYRARVNIRESLQAFVRACYPDARVLRHYAGPIPCGSRRVPIATEGLMKAGDAASTINPISRAGIVEAMHSGALAGEYAVEMLGCEKASDIRKLCKAYHNAWLSKLGKRHLKLARVKHSLATVPDSDYNRAVRTLCQIPPSKLTMARIFKVSVGRFPRLVWALRHLM
jgi:geranylgeranyl reductase family protein